MGLESGCWGRAALAAVTVAAGRDVVVPVDPALDEGNSLCSTDSGAH